MPASLNVVSSPRNANVTQQATVAYTLTPWLTDRRVYQDALNVHQRKARKHGNNTDVEKYTIAKTQQNQVLNILKQGL